jgi:membrane associated rhomboid family serine protease
MGIYDREYYRSDGPGFLGTFVRRGQVCKWLIVANAVAFVIQLATRESPGASVDGWFTDLFILDPDRVVRGEVWRLITGGFLHSFGWQHIVFNMLFLWWMGSEVEDIYGPKEFLGFYFAAELVSSLAYVAFAFASSPIHHRALGASGAVTAVMVLFAMHYPTRTVLLFFFLPVPVILLVVFNVLQDTIGLFGGSKQPIAFAAHLGGAAFGFLYGKFQWRVTTWLPSFALPGLRLRRNQPKLRGYGGEPEPRPRPSVAKRVEVDEHIEAELDDVLAKVARYGKSSLSEREQKILLRASEIYRQRRK